MPRVAILISVYNRSALTATTIETALGRTIRDIEVIGATTAAEMTRAREQHSNDLRIREVLLRIPVYASCARREAQSPSWEAK